MSNTFNPTDLFAQYSKPSDIEFTKGQWVHPKFTYGIHPRLLGARDAHIETEIIVGVAGKVALDPQGQKHGLHGVYFGPGNHWNASADVTYPMLDEADAVVSAVTVAVEMTLSMRLASQCFDDLDGRGYGHPDPPINSTRGSRLESLIIKSDCADVLAFARDTIERIPVTDHEVYGIECVVRDAHMKQTERDKWALLRLTILIEHLRRLGVEVRFWCVSEGENREAHFLADHGFAAAAVQSSSAVGRF